jgi:hypothetical protein
MDKAEIEVELYEQPTLGARHLCHGAIFAGSETASPPVETPRVGSDSGIVAKQVICPRCKQRVSPNEPHTFYTWDVKHECGHEVAWRAVCDAHAFSSPLIGINTSTFVQRIAGEPCPWCGAEVKATPSSVPPTGVDLIETTHDPLVANMLAQRKAGT